LRSKNPKVVLNLWQKLREKFGKVAPEVARNFAHFWGVKYYFGPLVLWQILATNN